MSRATSESSSWLVLLLVVALSPLIAVALMLWLILWLIAAVVLSLFVWLAWCARGKDILFVYSNSPIWHDYIDEHIIPRIKKRAIIINWSERRHWLDRFTLRALVFRLFGGSHEYNPMAIHFIPFWPHQTFRFWQAFRDQKHGKTHRLMQLESEFFRSIGLDDNSRT